MIAIEGVLIIGALLYFYRANMKELDRRQRAREAAEKEKTSENQTLK
ncbi:MAG: hypothetical protein AAF619_10770 [Pseudomonadota bacterium]